MIEALTSLKRYRPKDEEEPPSDSGRHPTVDFRGDKRSRDSHQSKTDPDACQYKKSKGTVAKFSYLGHVLMENRNGLAIDAQVTGMAEREAAIGNGRSAQRRTPGDVRCGQKLRHARLCGSSAPRQRSAARSTKHHPPFSAIDGRTTGHRGYVVSQRFRKRFVMSLKVIKNCRSSSKALLALKDKFRFTISINRKQ